jgi:multidrug efflux pump subunit AcrB
MMTTAAAMLAGVPLALGTGMGSELRQPLGYAMVGSLALSPVIDALHNTGDLSLSRPLAIMVAGR